MATEIECYAIISEIEKWHKYLDGRPFTIETDHKPLELLNLKQQLNMKCERWRLKLQRYHFTIRYIKGNGRLLITFISVWKLLSMDFHGSITSITPRDNKYIISLTDVLSKFVITKAVRDCTPSTAARFVKDEVILKYGRLRCIITDNGTHFTADIMEELFKKIEVTHLYSTPYHPMTNGQIERYNATMDDKIAALCNKKRTDWDEQLPFVSFNYNTNIHTTTEQILPFEMMYGRSPVLPFDHQQAEDSIQNTTLAV
ncbi:unnamed protein product [Didymodactylos carnosus]|uniref:Integrase catalytic domain-containing protein n=1 Tax=Didymodactylos carnosus TaxID=1234261 RepID=A0A814JP17_9BILA|nr:unnamed protein product [Didymodactylos carnosus]CAF3808625.1 unnamed protein product [Didymodactylos carnosus]